MSIFSDLISDLTPDVLELIYEDAIHLSADGTATPCKAFVYSQDLRNQNRHQAYYPAQIDESGVKEDTFIAITSMKFSTEDMLQYTFDGEQTVFPLVKEATPAQGSYWILELGKRIPHAA